MEYTVYILYSKNRNRFYVGYCQDAIENRIKKHNSNHGGFTGKIGDWELKYTENYPTKKEAIQREKQIKGWKSRSMLEKLISFS